MNINAASGLKHQDPDPQLKEKSKQLPPLPQSIRLPLKGKALRNSYLTVEESRLDFTKRASTQPAPTIGVGAISGFQETTNASSKNQIEITNPDQ
jgi:short subunit dehydrogenase-like uncharacterized protein